VAAASEEVEARQRVAAARKGRVSHLQHAAAQALLPPGTVPAATAAEKAASRAAVADMMATAQARPAVNPQGSSFSSRKI
jgi:hypothetical protein